MSSTQNGNKVDYIPTKKIRENEVALRPVERDSEDYLSLSDSVKKRGILIPILVREFEDPEHKGEILYGLIDGLQRYNAALDAGLEVIPAQITTMNQAEIEETQIITNAQKIETRPVQYASQIERLLQRNPTMTVNELGAKLSKSPGWIYKMLGMVKRLHPDLKPLADDSRIKLGNAIELSKLPMEEQLEWRDKAQQMDSGDFNSNVAARIKQIRDARRKGRAETPATFQPVPICRKWGEVKAEYLKPAFRDSIIQRNKATTAQQGFDLAIAWVASMDPDSQAQQKMEDDARKEKANEEKEKKKLETTKKREEDAKKTREELQKKIDERAAAVVA